MKKLLPFLARLVVISLLFIPLLPHFHKFYRFILVLATTRQMPTGGSLDALQFVGSDYLYTFIVLMLATPGLQLKRRGVGILAGAGMFLFADFFMTAVWLPYLKTPRPSLANMAVSYGWLVVAHYLLPFLLWFVFAFRQIEGLFKGEGKPG